MAKKTDKVYSLMNVTNGNILSATLHGMYWNTTHSDKTVHVRKRNWKLSQFNIHGNEVLDYFLNGNAIEATGRYTMGVQEIWVKEDEIDLLYASLACCVLCNFTRVWENQKVVFGAFILNENPEEFLTRSKFKSPMKELVQRKLGKKFLMFLEQCKVLSFNTGGFTCSGGKWVAKPEGRNFFAFNEIELICKERQEIVTSFEYEIKKM